MFITYEEVANFQSDGYLLVENVFSEAEVKKMIDAVQSGDRVADTTRAAHDASGKAANLAIWHELGEDIWSAASTCPRVVNPIRILLGEEATFFHGKVMLKEAKSGGAWEWHQDYGYWYDQGFIYPHLISAFVALDPATRQNGCLRVLQGSHKLGRLNHQQIGNQTGVDPARMEQIESMFKLVECEMLSGSILFFHSNLLHSSVANDSEYHRRAFIMCYNAWSNPQFVNGQMITREVCPVGSDDII